MTVFDRPGTGTDWRHLLLLAIGALAAFVCGLAQVVSPFDGNSDVSWNIVAGEKMLAGGRLYHDILETNPPMTTLMYLPPIWLAGVTGVAAELTIHAWVVFWATVSLVLVWRLSPAAGVPAGMPRLLLTGIVAWILLIMPARSFGEREQFAAAVMLPWLLLLAARWNGYRPGLGMALVVGVLAGLAMCIKPHFALILLLPALLMLAARRNLIEHVTIENITASIVVLAYLAIVVIVFPDFLTTAMEWNRIVYMPSKLGPRALLAAPVTAFAILLGVLLFLVREHLAAPLPRILAAAAAGGFVVYALQAKGWAYHQLPTYTLALLALTTAMIATYVGPRRHGARLVHRDVATMSVALALMGFFLPRVMSEHTRFKALEAEIAKISPAPSLLIGSSDLGMHFPLVRRTNARWASRTASLWMTEGVARLLPHEKDPERRRKLESFYRWERANFASDAVAVRPDIIGLAWLDAKRNLLTWAREEPMLARLLEDYREVGIADDIKLFVRRDLLDRRRAEAPR